MAANLALVIAVLSGVALLLWYSPSVQFAYSSLSAIGGHTLGGWVRAVHRYSSDLAMLLLVVHAGRVFFARKFSGARWLPWVSGVAMLALVWFIGWTGYWLVWDQPAQQVAVSSMRLLDALPIFGEPLGRLYVSDRTVPSLLFFVVFFLHMLLPLAIALGLAVHLARVSRARLLPPRGLSLAMLGGVLLAAALIPAPLGAPAQMAEKAAGFTVDAWYLSPLALGLRFQSAGLWVALFGGMALGGAVPWILGRRRPARTYQALVTVSRCHACTQCVQDCPFDAIAMVARTDGKRFAAEARVDPVRCVGCGVCAGSCDSEGIAMTWFDTRVEEARIERHAIAAAGEGRRFVALVAGEIRPASLPDLPDFSVHAVPTASWVRPRFVEALLAEGVRGVLVVRDARAEAPARDGGRWVAARLTGERAPKFRPQRAADGGWSVVDFDPSEPEALARAAAEFRGGGGRGVQSPRRSPARGVLAALGVTLVLTAATIAPSRLPVANPAPAEGELVLSLRAFGDRVEGATLDAKAEAAKPIHMRGRTTAKPHRADVSVTLAVDGVAETRTFAAKGISRDGPAIGEWRRAWAAGEHRVSVEIHAGGTGVPARWEGVLRATERHLTVITFEAENGFVIEPGDKAPPL